MLISKIHIFVPRYINKHKDKCVNSFKLVLLMDIVINILINFTNL